VRKAVAAMVALSRPPPNEHARESNELDPLSGL
jgi:hypothetical protein